MAYAGAPPPTLDGAAYAAQVTPLSCEREPIHIVNRIQPCGTLLVVDSDLCVVQCSANAAELMPEGFEVPETTEEENPEREIPGTVDARLALSSLTLGSGSGDSAAGAASPATATDADNGAWKQKRLLDAIVGSPLSLFLRPEAVDQVRAVVRGAKSPVKVDSTANGDPTSGGSAGGSSSGGNTDAVRTFLVRTQGALCNGRKSCGVTQSGGHFLIEIEDMDHENSDAAGTADAEGEDDAMVFMQSIAHELRKCWSIEEMAGLVCSRIMSETPYDRGMVYRFDPSDGSGDVVYETTRWDARSCCREDSFLGLRFPASDIPRQARELFMKNTLRFVYDVQGKDHALYPSQIQGMEEAKYTDLSMCRLRGSSHIHLQYLRNMKVTSTLVIAIIVNKRLWGLYSFHGYRHPIRPSARTRFLCEMASVMTSMVMESLTRTNDHSRLMDIDQTLCNLQELSLVDYMDTPSYSKHLMKLLDVNLVAFRKVDEDGNAHIHTYTDDEAGILCDKDKVSPAAFQCLRDTYGQVCRDYGVVFIDETRVNPTLGSLHTLAFFQLPGVTGLDVLLSRKSVVEHVEWGGDPEKTLQSDGTLSPRSSFARFVKGHLKKGKPWDDADRQRVKRFAEKIEKYRSSEVFEKQNEAIRTLDEERRELMEDQKVNLDFFAFMAHELRTPFHGVLGSLEAMREDPNLANNQLLNQAYISGKNMIRILDDILLVAKGSYSLKIEEQPVDVSEFLHQTVADMKSYAYMEGVSVRVRKEDLIYQRNVSDFNRIRQVVHNLISNAIKFSEEDIYIELLQRRTFSEVLTVWKTYTASYPNHEPRLKDIAPATNDGSDDDDNLWIILSVIDKGIGIKAADLSKLGTAFTQLSQGRQKKYQGTGLGITISNMIISALKGQLVMFSAPEYGSCFTFAIPVKRGKEPTVEKKNLNSKEATKLRIEQLRADFESFGFADGGARKSPRVLVVDDSTINRKICSRKVQKLLPAVEITQCASGKSCIEEYEDDYANIMGIFLDFHMPGMDGDVVARKIREFEKSHEDVKQEVWIVGYTADILDSTRNILLEAGMNQVMPKPEPMHAFEAELRTMIRRAANEEDVRDS